MHRSCMSTSNHQRKGSSRPVTRRESGFVMKTTSKIKTISKIKATSKKTTSKIKTTSKMEKSSKVWTKLK